MRLPLDQSETDNIITLFKQTKASLYSNCTNWIILKLKCFSRIFAQLAGVHQRSHAAAPRHSNKPAASASAASAVVANAAAVVSAAVAVAAAAAVVVGAAGVADAAAAVVVAAAAGCACG